MNDTRAAPSHAYRCYYCARTTLSRTTDAGETWRRLDPGNEYSYIRKVFTHDGTVFFSGAIGAPPAWNTGDHESALFESTDFGRSWAEVDFPGAPNQVVEDWVVTDDGELLCGSGLFDIPEPADIDGLVLRRSEDGAYETVGTVPSSVGRMEVV